MNIQPCSEHSLQTNQKTNESLRNLKKYCAFGSMVT